MEETLERLLDFFDIEDENGGYYAYSDNVNELVKFLRDLIRLNKEDKK